MGAADLVIEEIQELLDAGYSMTKTASLLNLDHKQVGRVFKKHNLELYTPFDEEEDKKHLHQNFEWLWEEDKLESIGDSVFNVGKYKIQVSKTEEDIVISKYCIQKYGSLLGYLKQKNLSLFIKSVFMNCICCKKFISINGFHKDSGSFMGLSSRCKKCAYANLLDWRSENPGKVKANQLNRRAKIKLLRNDLTNDEIENILEKFDYGCTLSGSCEIIHMDHVIPIALGQEGTTFSNIIPLRADLNISKNDSNIFEWFEANRQRFELSQDRFDTLIAWLASANAMTVEEYRDYVYWCHANKRTIDELEAQ